MPSKPQKVNCGRLSYNEISSILGNKDEVNVYEGKSPNYAVRWNRYVNPVTHKDERAACMRLYATDILQFFEDGSLIVDDHPSVTTNQVLWQCSPIHTRGGASWNASDGRWYPMPGPLRIAPDGTVLNKITVYSRRVRPERKAERRALRKQFRENAWSRLVLREFPEIIAKPEYSTGFRVLVPASVDNRKRLYQMLMTSCSHGQIQHIVSANTVEIGAQQQAFGRPSRSNSVWTYANELTAAKAFMDCLFRDIFADSGEKDDYYHEEVVTEHKDLKVAWR